MSTTTTHLANGSVRVTKSTGDGWSEVKSYRPKVNVKKGSHARSTQVGLLDYLFSWLNNKRRRNATTMYVPDDRVGEHTGAVVEKQADVPRLSPKALRAHQISPIAYENATTAQRELPFRAIDSLTDLYDRAVYLVAVEQKASTSLIQRWLDIGYYRASQVVVQMEQEGIVSAPDYVGKRTVLVYFGSQDDLE